MFEKSKKINFGYVVDYHSDLVFPKYGLNEKNVIKEIMEKMKEGIKLSKIEEEILKVYFNMNLNTLIIKGKGLYGGNCTLGTKTLFIRVNGDFCGCEKTRDSFIIGDIKKGFDLKRIVEIEREWILKTTRCEVCPAQAFCTACVATLGFKGKIEIMRNFCMELLRNFKEKVREYLEFQKI